MHYCANNIYEFSNGIFLNFSNLFKKIMLYHSTNKSHFLLFHSDYTIDMDFYYVTKEYSHVQIRVYESEDIHGKRSLFVTSTSHPAVLYYTLLLLGKYGYNKIVDQHIRDFQSNYIFNLSSNNLQTETFKMTEFPTLSKINKFFNTHGQKQK